MPRYHFHVFGGGQYVVDADGVELPDPEAARAQVLETVHELWPELLAQGVDPSALRFEVTDEDGDVVLVIPFNEARGAAGQA